MQGREQIRSCMKNKFGRKTATEQNVVLASSCKSVQNVPQ